MERRINRARDSIEFLRFFQIVNRDISQKESQMLMIILKNYKNTRQLILRFTKNKDISKIGFTSC